MATSIRTHRRARLDAGPAAHRFRTGDQVAYRVWRFVPLRGWELQPREAVVIGVYAFGCRVITDHDGGQRRTLRFDQLEPWGGQP